MTGLPYIKPPQTFPPRRIGNDAVGILEVPVLGGLTVEEIDTVTKLLDGFPSARVAEAEAAIAIAAAEGCTPVEAHRVVTDGLSGLPLDDPSAETMRLRHAARIHEVLRIYEAAGRLNRLSSMTAIIRHRLNRPEWTMAETLKLPRLLGDGLWQLVMDEQDAEALPTEPVTEEDLKKPPADDGDPSEPTGPESSGACPMASPASGTGKRSGKS
jgi:hypothetical protein